MAGNTGSIRHREKLEHERKESKNLVFAKLKACNDFLGCAGDEDVFGVEIHDVEVSDDLAPRSLTPIRNQESY